MLSVQEDPRGKSWVSHHLCDLFVDDEFNSCLSAPKFLSALTKRSSTSTRSAEGMAIHRDYNEIIVRSQSVRANLSGPPLYEQKNDVITPVFHERRHIEKQRKDPRSAKADSPLNPDETCQFSHSSLINTIVSLPSISATYCSYH